MKTRMIIKVFLLALITTALLEIALRFTFTLPDLNVYRYDSASDIILFKQNLNAQINTRRQISFKKNTQENQLPQTVHLLTDQNGFRKSEKQAVPENAEHLILGDSITLGWPLTFEESALMIAQQQIQQPISSCAFMAMGAVQLYKLIELNHCPGLKKLKTLTIQITLHNTLTFPDTLFIDNLGDRFQSKLIFSINNPDKEVSYISTDEQRTEITNFNQHYFNTHLPLVNFTYLGKIFFNLGTLTSTNPFKKFELLVQDNVKETSLHENTLNAIEKIATRYAVKPTILVNRTKNAMTQASPRPEVTALLEAFNKKGYLVKDMIDEKNRPGMPNQFYYINDFHPNAQGHQLLGKKLAELINK